MLAPSSAAVLSLLLTIGPIAPGQQLPVARGEFLTGRTGELPAASRGHVALVLFGFTYASRKPVEAWADRFHAAYAADSTVTLYEVPVMNGMAWMGKPFIVGGMRKGTPVAQHEHVVLLWGVSGPWKQRLGVHHRDAAYAVVLDREGRVRWLASGLPDDAHWGAATAAIEAAR